MSDVRTDENASEKRLSRRCCCWMLSWGIGPVGGGAGDLFEASPPAGVEEEDDDDFFFAEDWDETGLAVFLVFFWTMMGHG